jgi:hypothetical protein
MKTIIFTVLLSILLTSCTLPQIDKGVSPWVIPTQVKSSPLSTQTLPSTTEKPTPISIGPCKDIPIVGIQRVTTVLQNSHILYLSKNSQNQKDELWVASLFDGTVKQLNKVESLRSDFGFLKDGFHYAMLQYDWAVVVSDIDDSRADLVDVVTLPRFSGQG